MSRKALKRNEAPRARNSVRGASVLGKPRKRSAAEDESLEELFGVEPFLRNEVNANEIRRLQNMIDAEGIPSVSEKLGVDKATMLTVTSGFGHRLRRTTAERIREFLRSKK